jgi:uncharacterized membrane protein YdjX (TVP38/TMEM64 family)
MIEFAWFVIGLTCGVCGTFGYVMYLGHREIAKRSKRSKNWQKVKKSMDKEFNDEYGV